MTTANDILKQIKENDVKFVDLRFTDPKGKLHHVTMDIGCVDEDMFADGVMFDGSSIGGWKAINESDMALMPDPATATLDPFFSASTLSIVCDVLDQPQLPRRVVSRPQQFLHQLNEDACRVQAQRGSGGAIGFRLKRADSVKSLGRGGRCRGIEQADDSPCDAECFGKAQFAQSVGMELKGLHMPFLRIASPVAIEVRIDHVDQPVILPVEEYSIHDVPRTNTRTGRL